MYKLRIHTKKPKFSDCTGHTVSYMKILCQLSQKLVKLTTEVNVNLIQDLFFFIVYSLASFSDSSKSLPVS